jgi:hypothetical protein
MNVKYQIFVSSTYEDLKDERNEIIKACLSMGDIPVGMEMFNAADEGQWAIITRTIDQCDYYVVIVAHRYGSTVDGISFTEKEYDYAVSQRVPVLGFVIEDGALWPNDRIDKDPAAVDALRAFKAKVRQKMVRTWGDKAELQAHFAISLGTYKNTDPRRGWVQAPEVGATDVTQTLSNLAEENGRLRQALDEAKAAAKDEVVQAIDLLRLGLGGYTAQDLFIDAVETSEGGSIDHEELIRSWTCEVEEGDREPQIRSLRSAFYKFEWWGLISGVATVPKLTELGRRVYKSLDLQRRSGPQSW